MKIGLSSATLSQMDMTDLARWTIRPRLMAVPGVANVAIWGERDRQFQVLVDPDRLRSHNVTLDAVVKYARDAVTPETGGFIDTPNQRLSVTNIQPVKTVQDLAKVQVPTSRNAIPATPTQSGFTAPLRLGEIADVREGFPPPICLLYTSPSPRD